MEAVNGREVLWPEWLVDGDVPRFKHLNVPWDQWRGQERLACAVAVAGSFRRSELFALHRERIRDVWLGRPVEAALMQASPRTVTVLARVSGNRAKAFPKPAEIAAWTVGMERDQVLVLLPHGANKAPYADLGFSAECMSDWMRLSTGRKARHLLVAEGPLGWWTAFLSKASRIVAVRHPTYDRH